MLSITKINSAKNQAASGQRTYAHYLGEPSTRQRGDFDDYARGGGEAKGPLPFWACKGAALLGLDDIAEAEQVERLARGFHPVTGAPLAHVAGQGQVVKRLRLRDGGAILESDNPDYADIAIEDPSALKIHGVVKGSVLRFP